MRLIKPQAVVIGASAGGLNALQTLLSHLPANFALPIMIVQHRDASSDAFMVHFLNQSSPLTVKEADEKETITAGMIYLAPANYHLLVERDKTFSLSVDAQVGYSRPSIDVLFESASEAYLSGLIGIILTGANNDGTAGLKKIKERGGLVVAQDPTTAEMSVMPRAAIQAQVVDKILSLANIAVFLKDL